MSLNSYVHKKVIVISTDGRTFVGTLISCDQSTNLVLQHCVERIITPYDSGEDSKVVELGVYLLRGDTVALCGLVDEELDKSITWENVHGEEIGGTKHVK